MFDQPFNEMGIKKIAIFASGTGSNAKKILEYAHSTKAFEVAVGVTNKRDSGFADLMLKNGIKTYFVNNSMLSCETPLEQILLEKEIDLIVLAGFLRKIPDAMIDAFPNKIINIHPSLLPKHGGKGMYGLHVHEAVKAANDKETGITIHFVNKEYDKGAVILQERIQISQNDSPVDIAQKVQQLEHEFFPKTIEKILADLF